MLNFYMIHEFETSLLFKLLYFNGHIKPHTITNYYEHNATIV